MNYIKLFSKIVSENEKKIAIIDQNGKRATTYNELDALSDKVSGKLKSLNVNIGDFIVLEISRRMEFVAASLGVMKAGAVVVPLSNDYPEVRKKYIEENCNAKVVITDDFFDDIDKYEKYINLADDKSKVMLFYTSGSTGNPKGVIYGVDSFANIMVAQEELIYSNEVTKIACLPPFYFIISLILIYPVLLLGRTIHILSDELKFSIELLLNYFKENNIDLSFIPVQVLKLIKNVKIPLKIVYSGGEQVSDISSKNFVIRNAFGQTELLGAALYFDIDKEYENAPIGKPIKGIKAYICDDDGKEVEDGKEGEIYIEGLYDVEYFNDEERTKKTFIKLDNKMTLVHTGDMGKKDENGNIVYTTRKDWMVKINGQRVEMPEVEHQMINIEGVTNAVVTSFVDNNKQTYIVGYYETKNNVSEEVVKEELTKKLPHYMVPRYIVRLEELPKNANGKLDRKALKTPKVDDVRTEYVAPTNENEKLICDVFSKVLGVDKVGINDDFLALGGDSIKIIDAISLIGNNMSLEIIYEERTPYNIAKRIGENSEDLKKEKLEDYPITKTQYGIYIESELNKNTTIYNIPTLVKMGENVDIDKLVNSLKKVVNAHYYIKTQLFINKDGKVRAKRRDDAEVKISLFENKKPDLDRLVRPFYLIEDDLYRMEIYVDGADKYLFTDFHHIICDGESEKILLNDINKAYKGEEIKEEEYSGYEAGIKEEKTNSELYKKAEEYYDTIFTDCDLDSLPSYDIEIGDKKAGICSYNNDLSYEEVETYCKKNNISQSALFNSAFAYVLALLNGKKDSLYTTVYNGRSDARFLTSVSMYVKTLPMLCKFEDNDTVKEYIQKVTKQLMNNMSNDIFSFVEISNKYGIKSDILFVYQGNRFNMDKFCNDSYEKIALFSDTAKSPIAISCFVRDNKFVYDIEYKKELYTETFMKYMAEYISIAVKEFMTKEKLSQVNLMTNKQKEELDEFNNKKIEYDATKSVIDIVRDVVCENSEKIAVIYEDKKITYKEFDDVTEKIGQFLHNKNIGKEDIVAALIERDEYMPIVSIGILKSGAAYQPLDYTYPTERLEFMMDDAKVKFLIANKHLMDKVPNYKGDVLFVEDIDKLEKLDIKLENPKPEDLFIMLYTSGTTGLPKGCMLEHRNIVAFFNCHKKNVNITKDSVFASYASYGFDMNMVDIYSALLYGGTVCIVPENIRLDMAKLNEFFNENKITHACITTQVGRLFTLTGDKKYLKYICLGGEKLVPFEPPKGIEILNAYGPTENTMYIIKYNIDKMYRRVPIGKVACNSKAYIVDENLRRVPMYVPGELCVAGPQVFRGYLNRKETEEKVLIKNPFDESEGYQKIYRTNDIVRMLPDGNIDYIGRNDKQVKVRGFRIELTEVEEVIRRYEGIKDATVSTFESKNGGQELVAYIVSDQEIDKQKLKNFILSEKPAYIVPAVIMQIEKIPLNQNQKVNKRALPKPTIVDISNDIYIEPRNDIEKKICDIFADVLSLEKVSVNADFYKMGGNSLLAIELISKCNIQDFSIKELFEYRTPEKIAEYCDKISESKNDDNLLKIDMREGIEITYGMKTIMWMESGRRSTLWNIPILIKLKKTIDIEKFAKAVDKVFRNHKVLSSYIYEKEGKFYQKYDETMYKEIEIEDVDEKEFLQKKQDLVKVFDIVGGELHRKKIYRTKTAVYFFFDIYHIINDGVSLNIIFDEIMRVYNDERYVLNNDYYDEMMVSNINEEENDETIKKRKIYEEKCNKIVESNDFSTLPNFDFEVAEGKTITEKKIFNIVKGEKDKNKYFRSVSNNEFFIGALALAISKYNSTKNVCFHWVYNGRDNKKYNSTVGFFLKNLPLFIMIDPKMSIDEYFSDIKEQVIYGIVQNKLPYSMYENPKILNTIHMRYQNNLLNIKQYDYVDEIISLNNYDSISERHFAMEIIDLYDLDTYTCGLEYTDGCYKKESIDKFFKIYDDIVQKLIKIEDVSNYKISNL